MMLVSVIEKTKSSSQSGVKQKDTPSGEQKKRVDGLLAELIKAFPPKVFQSKVYKLVSYNVLIVRSFQFIVGWSQTRL